MKEIYTFYKKMLPILALLLVCSTKLFATDYYWIGAAGDHRWVTPGNWATTSGAAVSDLLYSPTINDNVIFDQNSFTVSDYTVIIDATAYCDSLIYRGTMPAIPVLTINADMYINGSMLLYPGMQVGDNSEQNRYTLYFQSTRANETFGYTDNSDINVKYRHINISGSANWTITGTLVFTGWNGTVLNFSSTGNLTVYGDLTGAYQHWMNFGGPGTKNITGNITWSGGTAEYGPVNIGGDLIGWDGSISIQYGSVVTVEGNVRADSTYIWPSSFSISGTGSELCVKGSITARGISVGNYGTLNNVSNKDIICSGAFNRSGNGKLLGISGITLQCQSWSNDGTVITATDAPALIRVAYDFTAFAGDVYNNVEVYGKSYNTTSIQYRYAINNGTYNKITFLPTSGYDKISTTASITTDTLIIAAQSEFRFSTNPTYVNKYLEIVPQPCGGMVSIKGTNNYGDAIGTIVMGSGSNVNVKNSIIENMTITGTPPYTAVNSVDAGGNTNWNFNTASNTQYWVGGGGNWDDHQHWANVSGGAPASGCIPTIFDNVVFDENSGLNNTDVVSTNGVTAYCDSMTWRNISGSPTFNIPNDDVFYIGGSLELNAGMKFNHFNDFYSRSLWFVSNRAGETIKSNGVVFNGSVNLTFHSGYILKQVPGTGNGGWILGDDLYVEHSSTYGYGQIYFYRGNLDFGGKAVTAFNFLSTGSLNRTLNIANSLITLDTHGDGLATHGWNYTGTNSSVLTTTETRNSLIRINGSVGRFSDPGDDYGITAKSGDQYYNVVINAVEGPYRGTVSSGIFNKITFTGSTSGMDFTLTGTNLETDSLFLSADLGHTYKLATNIKVNQYFQGPIICGRQSNLTSNNSTARLITMGTGADVNLKNLLITNVNITGDQAPYPAPDCELETGAETGWAPSSTAGTGRYYWVGGTGNWGDMAHWSNISGGGGDVYCTPPRTVNTVVFDENSFDGDNQSVTLDYHAFCDSMLWSNIPYLNPRLYIVGSSSVVITLTISGSLLLQEGMTLQRTGGPNSAITFNSEREEETLKTNGVVLDGRTGSTRPVLNLNFINKGKIYIPDGLKHISSVYNQTNYTFATIYFGKTSDSDNAQWIFGGPLQVVATIYFNYGILNLSESGNNNELYSLTYTTGSANHNTARELIMNNATINMHFQDWNYNGVLAASNSENSTINFFEYIHVTGTYSPFVMTTDDNQTYNNVTVANWGTINVPAGATTHFNRVIFQNTDVNKPGTVNRGVYKYLQFKSHATINGIEADTLYFANNNEYVYTFTSNAINIINKKWYGSGSPCTQISVHSSDVNGLPNPATIQVKKEAATMEGDTLFLDFIRLNGIYFTAGAEYAKMKLGPGSAIETVGARYYNNPVPGNITNCVFMTYDNKFRRLGPDVTLCYGDYPYELSSAYYVTTPTSLFEWKKGTTDGIGGIALNANPTTDNTTTSWIVQDPGEGTESYWLKVLYPVLNGPTCSLAAYKLITTTDIPAPICEESYILCYGNTIADLIAEIGGDIVIFANPDGGSALNSATPLQNNTTYYAAQTIDDCTGFARTTVEVKLKYCGNVFEIWNWADLAYLNVLIENEDAFKNSQPLQGNLDKLTDYEVFLLMQDLGTPDNVNSYGTGAPTVKNNMETCNYSPAERQLGCYGYENYLNSAFSGDYDHTGATLLVGKNAGWALGRPAWDITGNTGWIPVGNVSSHPLPSPLYFDKSYGFKGNFDGQAFVIHNLWINRHEEYQGLFGYTKHTQISDLGMVDFDIKAKYAGGLVERADTSTIITRCYAQGDMLVESLSGGLVGSAIYSEIKKCYANVNITGDIDIFGGLVGDIWHSAVTECYATGNLTGFGDMSVLMGGLVGEASKSSTITNCYATGNITVEGMGMSIGGFVGDVIGGTAVSNCYATGNIDVPNSIGAVGGFAGISQQTGTIYNCFALNQIVQSPLSTAARITNWGPSSGLSQDNYAFKCMLFNGDTIKTSNSGYGHNNIHGENISFVTATNPNASGYPTFDFGSTWTFVDVNDIHDIKVTPETNLPVLQAFNNTIPIFETTVQEAMVEDCERVFRIWNWADLAYLNVLIDNKVNGTTLGNGKTIDYYELFLLMQDLGTPNDINSYGKGVATEKNDWVTCPYPASQPERRLGCYGYENFISGSTYDYTQLLVGNGTGWLLGREAWDMSGNTGWIPVGKDGTYPFVGNFDGQGFTVNNLWINETNATHEHYIGLFGYATGEKIENLGVNADSVVFNCVTDIDIYVGVLAGTVGNIEIHNCYATGFAAARNVTGEVAEIGGLIGNVFDFIDISDCYASVDIESVDVPGGLIGNIHSTTANITNCYATGNITTVCLSDHNVGYAAGGLFAGCEGTTTVTNCYATGNLNVKIMGNATIYVVGGLFAAAIGNTTIDQCYATGSITVEIDDHCDFLGVGGFAAGAKGYITNCYTTSNVNIYVNENNDALSVGGFIGGGYSSMLDLLLSDAEVANSYATGKVNVILDDLITVTNLSVGGFAGHIENVSSINNSFALNPEVNAPTTDIARFVGKDDGADLQNNYALHCMTLNGNLVDPSDPDVATNLKHGENILFRDVIDPVKFKAAPYANAWDWTNSWVFPGGGNVQIAAGTNLPVLQAFNKTKPIFENTVQKAIAEQCEKERYWVYDGDPENGATFIYSYHWLQDAVNRVWTEDGGTFDQYGWYGPVGGYHFFIVATEKDTNVTEGGTYSPTTAVTIPEGMILTFTSLTGEIDTIIQPNHTRHIRIMEGASLTLTNIIIEGKGYEFGTINENGGIYVYQGELIVEEGAIIRENLRNNGGGGVFMEGSNSKFTINGGEISNNEAGQGGGVYAYGGEIKMTGGTISGNHAEYTGGGIYVYGCDFTMYDGAVISGNSAAMGGGVYTYYNTFTMEGGVIDANSAESGGGVVATNSGNFIMNNGKIINNKAVFGSNYLGNGGGVYVGYGSTFEMNGGIISRDTATGVSTHMSLGELLQMMGVDSTAMLTYLGITNFNEFTLNEVPLFFAALGVPEEQMGYILAQIGFNVDDLLDALTTLGLQIDEIDNSNIGTLLTEMGIDGQGFIEVLTNYFISAFGLSNTGSGGGVFLESDATFVMTGGKIFENLASEDGGGIFTMNYDYPTPMNAYDNITIPNNCTDSVYDNRALAGKFIPPTEPLWDKAFEISLLDNYQINYKGEKADDCDNPPTVDFDGPDEICEGTTTQLTPADAGWVSDNPSIATVDASGKVTALTAGTTTFTFTDSNNCTATTAPLTVKPKVKVSATIRIKN